MQLINLRLERSGYHVFEANNNLAKTHVAEAATEMLASFVTVSPEMLYWAERFIGRIKEKNNKPTKTQLKDILDRIVPSKGNIAYVVHSKPTLIDPRLSYRVIRGGAEDTWLVNIDDHLIYSNPLGMTFIKMPKYITWAETYMRTGRLTTNEINTFKASLKDTCDNSKPVSQKLTLKKPKRLLRINPMGLKGR